MLACARSVALVAALAIVGCGGKPEGDASSSADLTGAQETVGLQFAEKLDGSFHAGDVDESPGHLQALDPNAGTSVEAELGASVANFDAFLASPEHQADLHGTVRFSGLRGQALEAPAEPGSTLQILVHNDATGAFEFRYHVLFRQGPDMLSLDAKKLVRKHPTFRVLDPLDDFTILYGSIRREGDSAPLGAAMLKFQVFQSLDTLRSTARFFLSFEVTGTNDVAKKASVLARFDAFIAKIILDTYGPVL
jgi:hypothetical protein